MKFDRDEMIMYLESQLKFNNRLLTERIEERNLGEALAVLCEMDTIKWFIEVLNEPEQYGCNAMEE